MGDDSTSWEVKKFLSWLAFMIERENITAILSFSPYRDYCFAICYGFFCEMDKLIREGCWLEVGAEEKLPVIKRERQ